MRQQLECIRSYDTRFSGSTVTTMMGHHNEPSPTPSPPSSPIFSSPKNITGLPSHMRSSPLSSPTSSPVVEDQLLPKAACKLPSEVG